MTADSQGEKPGIERTVFKATEVLAQDQSQGYFTVPAGSYFEVNVLVRTKSAVTPGKTQNLDNYLLGLASCPEPINGMVGGKFNRNIHFETPGLVLKPVSQEQIQASDQLKRLIDLKESTYHQIEEEWNVQADIYDPDRTDLAEEIFEAATERQPQLNQESELRQILGSVTPGLDLFPKLKFEQPNVLGALEINAQDIERVDLLLALDKYLE